MKLKKSTYMLLGLLLFICLLAFFTPVIIMFAVVR